MQHFVIEYHRPSGELRTLVGYEDARRGAAMERRFVIERDADRDTEVAVLSADSLQTVRETHSPYFGNIRTELVRDSVQPIDIRER